METVLDMQNAPLPPPPPPNSPPPGSVRETAVDYCRNDARLLKDGEGQAKDLGEGECGGRDRPCAFCPSSAYHPFFTVVNSLSNGRSNVLVIRLSKNKALGYYKQQI